MESEQDPSASDWPDGLDRQRRRSLCDRLNLDDGRRPMILEVPPTEGEEGRPPREPAATRTPTLCVRRLQAQAWILDTLRDLGFTDHPIALLPGRSMD